MFRKDLMARGFCCGSEIRIYEILKAAKGAGRNCEKKQKERLLIRRDKIILPVLNLNLKLPNLTEVTV